MKKNVFAAVLGSLCALFFYEPHAIGQDLSGTNLNVSGTATIAVLNSGSATINLLTSGTVSINALDVTGIPDFQSNVLFFGTSGTTAALSLIYNNGTSGTNSSITLQSTNPSTAWNWQRLTSSGTAAPSMQLDASNRLILTGTDHANPTQLVLDPNGAVSLGGSNLLTQAVADGLYLTQTSADGLYMPSTTGVSVTNGNLISSNQQYFGVGATNLSCRSEWYTTQVIGQRQAADGYASQVWYIDDSTYGLMDFGIDDIGVPAFNMYVTDSNGSLGKVVMSSHDQVAFFCGSGKSSFIKIDGSAYFPSCVSVGGGGSMPQDLFTVANGNCNWYQDENGNWQQSFDSSAFVVKQNGDTAVYGALTVSGTSGGVNSINNGGLVLTGTGVPVTLTSGTTATKIVASGSNQLALVPEQGDLSMGDFINGTQPLATDSSQAAQQSMQTLAAPSAVQRASSLSGARNSTSTMTSGTARAFTSGTALVH